MDLDRLRKLSGIITEGLYASYDGDGRDADRGDTSKQEIIKYFRELLDVLKKEYPDDENMKGIIYHYEGRLDNEIHASEPDDEDDENYDTEDNQIDTGHDDPGRDRARLNPHEMR